MVSNGDELTLDLEVDFFIRMLTFVMRGIAGVNRVFNQKPGGLIFDEIGLGDVLK